MTKEMPPILTHMLDELQYSQDEFIVAFAEKIRVSLLDYAETLKQNNNEGSLEKATKAWDEIFTWAKDTLQHLQVLAIYVGEAAQTLGVHLDFKMKDGRWMNDVAKERMKDEPELADKLLDLMGPKKDPSTLN